ncbi:MAG: tetratricopeptide repeat protein [Chromatiaceae bacterium]|nr:tetratricopeptide repeat protein [Chromatiaceae bacterium]
MKQNAAFLVCLATLLLSACANNNHISSVVESSQLFTDYPFPGIAETPETPEEIFALPKHVKQELVQLVADEYVAEQRAKAVLEYIFSSAEDGLLYDNAATKTASETLQFGQANCLSLSILAFSMAKELGMDASFQDVQIPEYWTNQMGQSWLNGHVNIKLKQQSLVENSIGRSLLGSDVVIDFDPDTLKKRFPEYKIGINRVIAMFYNNKAAIAYAEKNYAQAYRYYAAAANTDPSFAVTWSNLAILYRQHGLYDLAEDSYKHSLAIEPDSNNTLANLAFLYRQTGNISKAEQLENRVLQKRKNNPYYYIMLGNEALEGRETAGAITHFKQAVTLDKTNHEAYFGLAKAHYLAGDKDQASRFMAKAKQYAVYKQDRQRYQQKLAVLNQTARVH